MTSRVCVTIVSYNSAQYLKACLDSLKAQTFSDFNIALWDNASRDNTHAIIEAYRDFLCFTHLSDRNLGFCEAHNRLIQSTSSEYVLVLNPDVILESRFLEALAREMDLDSSAGSATGKLFRQTAPNATRGISADRILDSTGIYFTTSQRHFDRGSNEIDQGQYDSPEYVFGASGAAALYRRAMLEEIRNGIEYFDESFFAYREDADLAWRAQWVGWRCRYVPDAVAYHTRKVLPENRSTLPDAINMHSFKNRFLLRVKNMDAGTYLKFFIPITLRDLAALLYVLLRERSSLPGIPLLIRALPRARAWRRFIQSRRRITPDEIRSWFSYTPVAKPVSPNK
jgi:GT2 family glycosyltransferase